MIANAGEGTFEGPKLKGKIYPSGGDWMLVGNDGAARLDVRLLLETHDGAKLYMSYGGVMVFNDGLKAAMADSSKSINYGDTYFVTQPKIETSDERYSYLNRTMFIGEGRVDLGHVEYKVFQLVN